MDGQFGSGRTRPLPVARADRPDLADARPAGQHQQQESMPAFLCYDPAGRWAEAANLEQRFLRFSGCR